ncbi:hypothetical protein FWJ25_13415 [Marinobacter salinexigens]|uniref:Lipoprotein n=1 Tax=Marinobacter salinexigens TaxID=2919747 RepID=A0A5B0VDL5_9GAMM|nr:hypothetical protein [Marinobacter salinexigens]KAA1172806.1 hypothetical protein FWJ25_13415 [Marinobacter salinexigens]
MQRKLCSVLFLMVAVSAPWADAGSLEKKEMTVPEVADFSDYPVEVSTQRLQRVDFDSHPDAASFKTRFRTLEGRSANFAGHYLLLYWGCGTSCQQFSIVDVETGQVFMDENWSTSMGVCFREDSALLITNPGAGESARVDSGYYLWDGGELKPLGRGAVKGPGDCDSAYE